MRSKGEGKKKCRSVRRNIYVRLQSIEYKNLRWKAKQKVPREKWIRKRMRKKEKKRKGGTVNKKN
jgi:hypothetical protein